MWLAPARETHLHLTPCPLLLRSVFLFCIPFQRLFLSFDAVGAFGRFYFLILISLVLPRVPAWVGLCVQKQKLGGLRGTKSLSQGSIPKRDEVTKPDDNWRDGRDKFKGHDHLAVLALKLQTH